MVKSKKSGILVGFAFIIIIIAKILIYRQLANIEATCDKAKCYLD